VYRTRSVVVTTISGTCEEAAAESGATCRWRAQYEKSLTGAGGTLKMKKDRRRTAGPGIALRRWGVRCGGADSTTPRWTSNAATSSDGADEPFARLRNGSRD